MTYRALGSVAVAAAIAFAQPVIYIAQPAGIFHRFPGPAVGRSHKRGEPRGRS